MESMIKFNKQLSSERKSRIPFLDQTTGIAQSNTNGMLWHDRSQRTYSNKTGQVFRYTAKSWFKNKRSLFDLSSSSLLSASSSSSLVILNTDLNNNNINNSSQILNETSNSSNISISNQQQQQQQLVFVNIPQTVMNKPIEQQQQQQSINVNTLITATDDWHEDNYDNFQNDENDSDYDEDDYKPKRTANKKHAKHAKKAKIELGLDEKPYACERCGAKYKTKPGLNYHVQKAHIATNNNTSNNSSRNGSYIFLSFI
jgi:zinc finger protein ubi-d4